MCNMKIRDEMKVRDVKQWQIAEYLGISEATMCRKMRHELDPEFRDSVINAIRVLGSSHDYLKTRSTGSSIVVNKEV